MKNLKFLVSTTAAMALIGLSDARGQEPGKPLEQDRFQVDPEVTKKFEEQANRPYVAEPLPVVEWEKALNATTQKVSARLLSTGDQSILVAVSLTPLQKESLSKVWPTVLTLAEADHQTILGDELCLRYPVALDYELNRLDKKEGQVLELEVGSALDGRPLVLFVRGS